jgi:hypothetical protein
MTENLTADDHKELKIWREYAEDKTRSDEERAKARRKIEEIMGRGLEGQVRALEKKVDELESRIVDFIGKADVGSIDPPEKPPAKSPPTGGLKSEATATVTDAPAAKKGTKKPLPGKPGGAGGSKKPSAGKPPADDVQF